MNSVTAFCLRSPSFLLVAKKCEFLHSVEIDLHYCMGGT